MQNPKTVLITGASSGIGAALAERYARDGRTVVLTGRDLDRLDQVAFRCRDAGAQVHMATIDVTQRDFFAAWLERVDDRTPIDLVVANAGVSGGTGQREQDAPGSPPVPESPDQIRTIFAVNIDGVINTLAPLVPRMSARRRGHIALMSSLAAFRGFPGAPAYCASKAAIRVYGEGLRGALRPYGVDVSVICPGFVRSAMTAGNTFRMPLLMDAERAARIIERGLERGSARIAFPLPLHFAAWFVGILPPALTDIWLARLPRKAAQQLDEERHSPSAEL